ncbi:5'/3'-nucleotidase SurE [Puia sp. P3]|uniref:5'/3'-nucleotidase SurE n=1 Tax=Puia sp. P3 TaxID=3423952 RepID=UPI003D66429E
MKGLGKIVVVAPDKPQSGMGHAITIGNPLRLNPMHHLFEGVEAWQCSGTPVDCVKLAVDKVLRRKPDLCLKWDQPRRESFDQRHLFRDHVRGGGSGHRKHSVHWFFVAGL